MPHEPHKVHLLIADDDPAVRRLLAAALPPHGFCVRLASGGREAVEVYRTHRDDIALVLLDVMMPGLDGPHALALLRELNPHVRCVFMSGDTGGYRADELLAMGADRVVEKPFRGLAELAGTLREVAASQA